MIFKGIAATTQVDAHNMRITKTALEHAAQDINNGKYASSVGIEHDLTIMPVGKVYKAYVDKFDQDEYALHIEQEIFDKAYTTFIDDEKFVMTKSEFDNRPFSFDRLLDNEKLVIQTDPVNFESFEKSEEYLSNLSAEFDIDTGKISRKSAIPDPELIFELVESSVKYLFIYLTSKQVIEHIGDNLVESALNELKNLSQVIKKAIKTGASYLLPQNRPVTYVFKGSINYVIEFVVKTSNPDVAINAISKDKLKEVFEKIDGIREQFSALQKVQFIYNENEYRWEFNYLTTEKGEVIGTEKSYKRAAKLIALHFGEPGTKSVSIGGSI